MLIELTKLMVRIILLSADSLADSRTGPLCWVRVVTIGCVARLLDLTPQKLSIGLS